MPTPLRVLIVEDIPDDAELMLLRLTAEGFQPEWRRVDNASDYLAALETPPDLILADWSLPQFSGLRALQLMRERGLDIPFIIVSGSVGEEAAIDALHQGAYDYVLKDRPARLGQAVRHALEEKQLREERRRAEEALQESEARYRAFINATSDMVFVKGDRFQHLVANPALATFFGREQMDIIGRTDAELMPAHAAEGCRASDQQTIQTQSLVVTEEQIGDRIYETTKFPVPLGGDKTGVGGIIRDITVRKRAEAEREQLQAQIQEQANQLAEVMHTVPEGVLLLDAAGRVVLTNPRAEGDLMTLAGAQVGDSLSHLGDRTLAELLSAPPRGLWHEAHGSGRIFEIIAKPIETGLSPDNWVLVLRDVTQEREVRQRALQGERLAAVGQLAAGVAHDFNNILAVIALDARLALAASDRVADVHERLATISGQAQRAADLVRQILDFSRQAVLERRPVALRPFLAEQIALLARILPESIALELAGAGDDCAVSADPTRLQQVVMNLAVNARDAMPEGGRLRFALDRVPALPSNLQPPAVTAAASAAWVRLTVADSGTGIPPEVLPRIFEPFFTTKGPGKGSGLGLSQAHGIVKQHGGEISVSTQAGVGTTFTIYLPALAESAAAEPVAVADEAPAAAGQTILIVEDDPTLRDALVDTVDLLGYRTLSAVNGREALAVLAQHREIALIMSDLVMPEMGGRALLQEVKQRGVTAPMVILSGHPLDDELASLQALGLAGWLLKPPEVEQLARLLAQALPGR